jgi:hypothetical protein
MPRARECVKRTGSQTGIAAHTNGARVATNEVIASSRDHDKLRVENTITRSATATRGFDRIEIAVGGMIPGPSTGYEVTVPGRQGIRACRDSNPARPDKLPGPLQWRGVARNKNAARVGVQRLVRRRAP